MITVLPDASFWSRVVKTETGCWIWTNKDGEMAVTYGSWRGQPAHRAALAIASRIPDPEIARTAAIRAKRWRKRSLKAHWQACHHCDNPPCVNPDHLYWGSPIQNAVDRDERGPKCEQISILFKQQCRGYGAHVLDDGSLICGAHLWHMNRRAEQDRGRNYQLPPLYDVRAVEVWARGRAK